MAENIENLGVTSPFKPPVSSNDDPVLYRNMTASQLLAQYNPWYNPYDEKDVFPDGGAEWFAGAIKASAEFKALCESGKSPCESVHFGLKYGSSDMETVDVFVANKDAPIHFFIHGGYWVMENLQPEHHYLLAQKFIENGVSFAVVNYQLVPNVTIGQIMNQVRQGLAYVYKNAQRLNFGNPDRIHISGHSAGGHLAAAMAGTDWTKVAPGLPHDLVKSSCPISACVDLNAIRHISFAQNMRLTVQTAQQWSPLFWKPPTDLPVCMVVGGHESYEFNRMSKEQADNWGRYGTRTEVLTIPTNHFDILLELVNTESAMFQKFMSFIHNQDPVSRVPQKLAKL